MHKPQPFVLLICLLLLQGCAALFPAYIFLNMPVRLVKGTVGMPWNHATEMVRVPENPDPDKSYIIFKYGRDAALREDVVKQNQIFSLSYFDPITRKNVISCNWYTAVSLQLPERPGEYNTGIFEVPPGYYATSSPNSFGPVAAEHEYNMFIGFKAEAGQIYNLGTFTLSDDGQILQKERGADHRAKNIIITPIDVAHTGVPICL